MLIAPLKSLSVPERCKTEASRIPFYRRKLERLRLDFNKGFLPLMRRVHIEMDKAIEEATTRDYRHGTPPWLSELSLGNWEGNAIKLPPSLNSEHNGAVESCAYALLGMLKDDGQVKDERHPIFDVINVNAVASKKSNYWDGDINATP